MLNNSLYIYLHFIVNSQNKIIIFLFESKFIELGFRNKNIFFMDLLVIRGDIYSKHKVRKIYLLVIKT